MSYPGPMDDFEPDDFVADDFVADDFEPDSELSPPSPVSRGSWINRGLGGAEWVPSGQSDLERLVTGEPKKTYYNRPDTRIFNAGEIFDKLRETGVNKVAMGMLPESLKPAAAMATSLSMEPIRFVAEALAEPEGLVGGIAGLFKRAPVPKPPTPEPPPPPVIRGLLPEPTDPYIVGPGGAQRRSLLNPQEEARLLGHEIGPEGPVSRVPAEPTGVPFNPAELREAERLRSLRYTDFEHQGGVPLEVPDRPIMDIPPSAGEVGLGFEAMVPRSGELTYPLNVIPQAVQPRSAQTVTRALAGDVQPVTPKQTVEFIDEAAPKPVVEIPQRDLRGGTAAIEPGEPLLPSAVRKVKENTGLNVKNVTPPKNVPEPIKTELKKGVENFVKESGTPSFALKSVYTQLKELGGQGKQLVYRFQRAAQTRAQYDAAWTEPLFKEASRLHKNEFANFGAYVEGRMPIPNQRVQKAVDAWNRAQNMMGDLATEKGLHLKRGDEIVPFEKVSGAYWPHVPVEKLTKKSVVDKLVKNGMSRHDAINVAKRWEATGEIFLRPQHSRFRNVFEYKDDFDVAIQHGRSMSKRIANHEHLGPKDVAGKGKEGVADLIEETTDPDLAVKLARRLAGRDALPSEKLMAGLNQSRKWMSLTSLPDFTVVNVILGQATNAQMALLSRHPIKVFKEITKLLKSSYRDEIRAAGVFNSFNRTMLEELQGIDPFRIGAGEKINRSIAGAIGRTVVREAFNDYKNGVNTASARYFLENLLARNPDEITAITPELERFAAGRMAEMTQGLSNPGNLPYAWSNPVNSYESLAMQLALIFKKIGFQVTKTVKDTIKADPKVAIPAWLGITQIAGEMVGDVKSTLTGRERPDDWTRIADNWGNAFMLGLPWELATSAQYGPTALIAATLGPAASKASEFGYNVMRTGEKLWNEREDPWGPLRRFGLKNLPIPGRRRIEQAVEED